MTNHMDKKKEITEKQLLFDYLTAFFKLLHIPLDWNNEDQRNFNLCGREHCNALCAKLRENEEGAVLCNNHDREAVETGIRTRQPVIRKCHAGFHNVLIPVFVESKYIGSLCIGQYLTRQPSPAEIKETLERLSFLKLTAAKLRQYYRKSPKFTEEEAEGLIELVKKIAEYISESYGRLPFFKSFGNADVVQSAEQHIQSHYASQMTAEGIARAIGMSKSYFQHRFKEQTGVSPMEYLNRYRIEKACDLLKNTMLNISEIAYAVGFANAVTFNRNFLKQKSMSPGYYRRLYGKEQ